MRPIGYLELLSSNRDFRLLWLGSVVSFLGDWFSTVALLELVRTLSDGALVVAGVLIAKTLPMFLVVPVAGPIVDRLDRRQLMVGTDVLRAVCVLGILVAAHAQSVGAVLAVLVVQVCLAGLFIPARQASIRALVPDESSLPVAMALSGGTWSVMLAVGAAMGGVTTELVGVDGALLLDCATYLVSAGLLAALPALPADAREEGQDTGFVDGLRYLAREPHIAVLAGSKSVLALAGAGLVMLPLFGDGVFAQAGPLWVGVLYASRGLGALLGSVGVRKVTGDAPTTMRRSLGPGYGVVALGMLGVAASAGVGWAALGYLVGAVGSGVVWVYSGTLLQLAADRRYRGRVFSMEWGIQTLMMSVMSLAGALLVDERGWSPREVMVGAGVMVVGIGVPWAMAVAATHARTSAGVTATGAPVVR